MRWILKAAIKWLPVPLQGRPKGNIDRHLEALRSQGDTPSTLIEIGAGWDARSAICRHMLGVKKQYLIDRKPGLKIAYVNENLKHFRLEPVNNIEGLKKYGIFYNAPADIEDLPNVDVISSHSVLEHIPENLLSELIRTFQIKSGRSIHSIDYKDHYSTFDSSITPYNFLRYGREWALFNPPSHYQNRLRHVDYMDRFSVFDRITDKIRNGNNKELESIKIHRIFKKYTTNQIIPIGSVIIGES